MSPTSRRTLADLGIGRRRSVECIGQRPASVGGLGSLWSGSDGVASSRIVGDSEIVMSAFRTARRPDIRGGAIGGPIGTPALLPQHDGLNGSQGLGSMSTPNLIRKCGDGDQEQDAHHSQNDHELDEGESKDGVAAHRGKLRRNRPSVASGHNHYLALTGAPVASGQYNESCRVIRVDGFQRVAADVNSEHLGLVATENSARSPVPSATEEYEDFVLDYLDGRFITTTAYNTIPGTANSIADAAGLNLPAQVSITKPNTGKDERWLHSRSLYIDFLEQEAIDYLADKKAECGGTVTAGCVLPYVPFTTINVTELARWMSQNTNVVNVTNNTGVLFGNPLEPVRGKVTAAPAATNNQTANIVPRMTKSNSGLALSNGVDPDDAVDNTDQQEFLIGSAAAEVNDTFTVFIGNMTFTPGNFPVISYRVGGIRNDCTAAPNLATPNPYTCATTTLNNNKGVLASNFNQLGSNLGDNPCTGNKTETDHPIPFCIVRTVNSVFSADGETASLSYVNQGRLNEVASASFSDLDDGETVAFVFNNPTNTPATGHTCGGPGNKTPTYTLPCQ